MIKNDVYFRVSSKIEFAEKNVISVLEFNELSEAEKAFYELESQLIFLSSENWCLTLIRKENLIKQVLKIRSSPLF